MPDVYGPFDGSAYQQGPYYRDHGYLDLSGVYGPALTVPTSGTGDLGLTTAGLTSSLALGRAHVRGASYERTGSAWTYTHPANTDPTLARIDRVVLRRDLAAKTVLPAVLQGTPGSGAPALTQSDTGIWEMKLHQVSVPNASGTLLTVTDERHWIPGRSGIPAGQNLDGDTAGQYRHHPTYGLQVWTGTYWRTVDVGLVGSSAYLTAGGAFGGAAGAWLAFAYDTVRSDPLSMFATGVWTCPLAGIYRLGASIGYAVNATGARGIKWMKRANSGAAWADIPGATTMLPAVGVVYTVVPSPVLEVAMAAGEQLGVFGYQSSGAALNVNGTNQSADQNSAAMVELVRQTA